MGRSSAWSGGSAALSPDLADFQNSLSLTRNDVPVHFIKRLPTSGRACIDVVVHEIPRPMFASGRCGDWVDRVHKPFIKGDFSRADRDWDWRWLIPLLTFGGGLARRPRLFQLCLAKGDFPVAMVSLLENERWIDDHSQSAVYVWYLTGAPGRAVAALGGPKMLTAAALDVAVTVSLNGPADGRLWLHAAPEGGDDLLAWYRARGMDAVPEHTTLPRPAVSERVNDGRYFYFTPKTARLASDAIKEHRV